MFTTNAQLCDLVRWAICWFIGGIIIEKGCITGTLGTATVIGSAGGLLVTLGGGVPSACCIFGRLAALGGGAGGVSIC